MSNVLEETFVESFALVKDDTSLICNMSTCHTHGVVTIPTIFSVFM